MNPRSATSRALSKLETLNSTSPSLHTPISLRYVWTLDDKAAGNYQRGVAGQRDEAQVASSGDVVHGMARKNTNWMQKVLEGFETGRLHGSQFLGQLRVLHLSLGLRALGRSRFMVQGLGCRL